MSYPCLLECTDCHEPLDVAARVFYAGIPGYEGPLGERLCQECVNAPIPDSIRSGFLQWTYPTEMSMYLFDITLDDVEGILYFPVCTDCHEPLDVAARVFYAGIPGHEGPLGERLCQGCGNAPVADSIRGGFLRWTYPTEGAMVKFGVTRKDVDEILHYNPQGYVDSFLVPDNGDDASKESG